MACLLPLACDAIVDFGVVGEVGSWDFCEARRIWGLRRRGTAWGVTRLSILEREVKWGRVFCETKPICGAEGKRRLAWYCSSFWVRANIGYSSGLQSTLPGSAFLAVIAPWCFESAICDFFRSVTDDFGEANAGLRAGRDSPLVPARGYAAAF